MSEKLRSLFVEQSAKLRRAVGEAIDRCYLENAATQGVPVDYLLRHFECVTRVLPSGDGLSLTVVAELRLRPEEPASDENS